MPGRRRTAVVFDRALAVCLLAFLALSPIVPLAARALAAATEPGMACCRTKAKCCCRKSANQDGAAISSTSCPGNCGQIAPGVFVTAAGLLPPAAQFSAPARDAFRVLLVASRIQPFRGSDPLRQRPPPSGSSPVFLV